MRFAIATLGCKVNQYDSAVIEDRLGAVGMERAEFDQLADVYIVNTCTVTDRADVESRRLARRARRRNPNARVIMTGCMAQANPDSLAALAEVDAVVGLNRLDDRVAAAQAAAPARVMVSNLRKTRPALEIGAVVPAGQTRAYLKLQEGCDQFCSFCIVPTSRGTSRSVPPRRVLEVLEQLHREGFQEVILSGVHLGGYGRDLGPPTSLQALLEMIAQRSPIRRLRLSSIDPEELSDEIIDLVAAGAPFCPHFHLPLQAGEDEVLSWMRRRYRRQEFRERVERIVARMPQAAIGTDLIAGFPGESAQHFDRYLSFVGDLPLAYFHVFPYSIRSGTTAAKLPGRVTPAEITRRAEILRDLGERRRREFAARFLGARLGVLVEEAREPSSGLLRGYSHNYVKVLLQGPDDFKNHEIEVETTTIDGATLVGRVASQSPG